MGILRIQDLGKSFGIEELFHNVSFDVARGDKIGFVGPNGAGKSTLMKCLLGIEEYDTGRISIDSVDTIGYMQQQSDFTHDNLYDELLSAFADIIALGQKKTTLEKQIENLDDDDKLEDLMKEYSRISDKFEQLGGYDYESRLRRVAFGLGFSEEDFPKNPTLFSGGQRTRICLAKALLREPDFLFLDEPTNHLDNGMIEYLEKFLIKWSKGLLMVTHDRYFLERVVNRIIEIDHGQIYKYEANYSKYLELKQARLETQLSSQRKRKLFLKKELEWVRAGVQARTTKSKDRLQRFEELSKVKDVEVNGKVEMIHTFSRLGKKTIELHEISKSFEQKKLFDEFSYMFKQHDRIGILGDNGTGKSTLLNIITGNLKSDMGYVEIGETVRFGYFKQGYDDLPMNKKVIDYIQEISNDFKVDGQGLSAKDMLERFLFDARLQHTPISRLSGGERRRLYLLRVLMMMPNVLVLDEPTNDLDIDTLNILEDYLDNFEGIIMTVSHDRYFLDRICDGLFILQNQHLRYVNGGYSQNLDTTTKEEKEKSQGALAYKQSKQKKIKMTYMEKKEFEEIEDIIMDLETTLSQIEEKMNGVTDFKKIDKLSKQRDDLQKQIDEKNERYLYLLELQEQIDNQ